MKKIIISSLFIVFIFSGQSSLAAYPATCPDIAQTIVSSFGGCSTIDRAIYSNVYEKCCGSSVPSTSGCTSFSYSNWSACQSNGSQTRIVVSKSPTGCTGGTPITSQTCTPTTVSAATSTSSGLSSLISTFTSSKNEVASGDTISLAFSGTSAISKYKIYFSCPKFSTGINAGLLAASAKIGEVEYCNKEFSVPTGASAQSAIIFSKYSKPLKITARLKAYDAQEQYVDYKDAILAVSPATTTASSIPSSTPVPSTSAVAPVTTSVSAPVSTMPTGTSIQEQINSLLNQIKILQQQLASQQSSSAPTTSSATPTTPVATASSATSASTSEFITETALSNESAVFSYTWNTNLYYGMKNNDDVKALQRALTKEGVYSNEITGNFFGLTRQAVIDFQKKNNFTNVPGTGYIGSYTRKVLNELYSK